MAMRITTKMMQSTSLRNLNANKSLEAKLTNQLATGKKIDRPSDDPVIAIRSLRLNSSLDKIDQYYNKNVTDAKNWLDLTSKSIGLVADLFTNDITQNLIKLKSDYLTPEDRKNVINGLRGAATEVYSIGNTDSGGRTIFTGYRTDLPLTLPSDKTEKNTITEQFTNQDIKTLTYVATGKLKDINEGNFASIGAYQYDVTTNEIYRMRLAYADIDIEKITDENKTLYAHSTTSYGAYVNIGYMTDTNPVKSGTYEGMTPLTTSSFTAYVNVDTTIGYTDKAFIKIMDTSVNPPVPLGPPTTSAEGNLKSPSGNDYFAMGEKSTVTLSDGSTCTVEFTKDGKIQITSNDMDPEESVSIGYTKTTDADGNVVAEMDKKYLTSLQVTGFYPDGSDEAYESVLGSENADKITYIAETGELLLGKNIQERLSKLPKDRELRVTYDKTEWNKDDLDPVHYFYTERAAKDNTNRTLKYNENFLKDPTASGKQIIEYDMGNAQSLRVNTTADELFTHDIGRDIEEVLSLVDQYYLLYDNYDTVKGMIDSEKYVDDDLTMLKQQLEALGKAKTLVHDKLSARIDELEKDFGKEEGSYRSRAIAADSACGARGARLTLIQNRLGVQQTSFEELVSENEDINYEEVAIQIKSLQMMYQAALSSISYVLQTSLLDFI